MSKMLPLYGFGSGNASLNFDIVSYDTLEKLLKAEPAENTIGIVTEAEITSYAFSPEAPSDPEAGMLWITVGTFSPGSFNALKRNAIQICPLSASQYVGGAWVKVDAMNYLGNTWVEWCADIAIYDSGVSYVDLTLTNASKNSGGYLLLDLKRNSNASVKSELVKLSGQKLLKVVYSNLSGNGDTFLGSEGGICARVWNEDGTEKMSSSKKKSSPGELTLDISGLAGKYMVGVYANNTSGSYEGTCRVKSIKVLVDEETSAAE